MAARRQEQQNRRKELVKYIPTVSSSIFKVLQSCAEEYKSADAVLPARKRRKLTETGTADCKDVLGKVTSGEITKKSFESKLTKHVEQYDATEALEFMADQGKNAGDAAAEAFFIKPLRRQTADKVLRLDLGCAKLDIVRDACHPACFGTP